MGGQIRFIGISPCSQACSCSISRSDAGLEFRRCQFPTRQSCAPGYADTAREFSAEAARIESMPEVLDLFACTATELVMPPPARVRDSLLRAREISRPADVQARGPAFRRNLGLAPTSRRRLRL